MRPLNMYCTGELAQYHLLCKQRSARVRPTAARVTPLRYLWVREKHAEKHIRKHTEDMQDIPVKPYC